MTAVEGTRLPLDLWRRGKVREVYEVDEERLLIVASDRVSAFDVVMAEPVPRKGQVLTQMSAHWFRLLGHLGPHHFLTADTERSRGGAPVRDIRRRWPVRRCWSATSPVAAAWCGIFSARLAEYRRAACSPATAPGLVESSPFPPIFRRPPRRRAITARTSR
jgi:phosphoribosylaminoimidazole-succinocarboxamide synthase